MFVCENEDFHVVCAFLNGVNANNFQRNIRTFPGSTSVRTCSFSFGKMRKSESVYRISAFLNVLHMPPSEV